MKTLMDPWNIINIVLDGGSDPPWRGGGFDAAFANYFSHLLTVMHKSRQMVSIQHRYDTQRRAWYTWRKHQNDLMTIIGRWHTLRIYSVVLITRHCKRLSIVSRFTRTIQAQWWCTLMIASGDCPSSTTKTAVSTATGRPMCPRAAA